MTFVESLIPGLKYFLEVDLCSIQLPPDFDAKRRNFIGRIDLVNQQQAPVQDKNGLSCARPRKSSLRNVAKFFSSKRHSLPPSINNSSFAANSLSSSQLPQKSLSNYSIKNEAITELHDDLYNLPSPPNPPPAPSSISPPSIWSKIDKWSHNKLDCTYEEPTNSSCSDALKTPQLMTNRVKANNDNNNNTGVSLQSCALTTDPIAARTRPNRLSLSPQLVTQSSLSDEETSPITRNSGIDNNNNAINVHADAEVRVRVRVRPTVHSNLQDSEDETQISLPKKSLTPQTRRFSALVNSTWTLAGVLSHRHKRNKWTQLNMCFLTNGCRLVAYKYGHSLTPSLVLFLCGAVGLYSGRDSGMDYVIKITSPKKETTVLAAPTEEQALVWVKQINQYTRGIIPTETYSYLPQCSLMNRAVESIATTAITDRSLDCNYLPDAQADSGVSAPHSSGSDNNSGDGLVKSPNEGVSHPFRRLENHRHSLNSKDCYHAADNSSRPHSMFSSFPLYDLSLFGSIQFKQTDTNTINTTTTTTTINEKADNGTDGRRRRLSLISSVRRKVESFSSKRRARKSLTQSNVSISPSTATMNNVVNTSPPASNRATITAANPIPHIGFMNQSFGWSQLETAGARFLTGLKQSGLSISNNRRGVREITRPQSMILLTSTLSQYQLNLDLINANYGPLIDLEQFDLCSERLFDHQSSNNQLIVSGPAWISIPGHVPWTNKWCCLRSHCLDIYTGTDDPSKTGQFPIFCLHLEVGKVELGLAGDKLHRSALKLAVPTQSTVGLLFDIQDKLQMGIWIRGIIQALGLIPSENANPDVNTKHSISVQQQCVNDESLSIIYDDVCPPPPSSFRGPPPLLSHISRSLQSFDRTRRLSAPLTAAGANSYGIDCCNDLLDHHHVLAQQCQKSLTSSSSSSILKADGVHHTPVGWYIPPPSRRLLAQPLPTLPSVGPSGCESLTGTITSSSYSSSHLIPDDDLTGFHEQLIDSLSTTEDHAFPTESNTSEAPNRHSRAKCRRFSSADRDHDYSIPYQQHHLPHRSGSGQNLYALTRTTNTDADHSYKSVSMHSMQQSGTNGINATPSLSSLSPAPRSSSPRGPLIQQTISASTTTDALYDVCHSESVCSTKTPTTTTVHSLSGDHLSGVTLLPEFDITEQQQKQSMDGHNLINHSQLCSSSSGYHLLDVKMTNRLESRDPALTEQMRPSKVISARRCVSCLNSNRYAIQTPNAVSPPISAATLPIIRHDCESYSSHSHSSDVAVMFCSSNSNSTTNTTSTQTATSSGVALTAESMFSSLIFSGSNITTRGSSLALSSKHSDIVNETTDDITADVNDNSVIVIVDDAGDEVSQLVDEDHVTQATSLLKFDDSNSNLANTHSLVQLITTEFNDLLRQSKEENDVPVLSCTSNQVVEVKSGAPIDAHFAEEGEHDDINCVDIDDVNIAAAITTTTTTTTAAIVPDAGDASLSSSPHNSDDMDGKQSDLITPMNRSFELHSSLNSNLASRLAAVKSLLLQAKSVEEYNLAPQLVQGSSSQLLSSSPSDTATITTTIDATTTATIMNSGNKKGFVYSTYISKPPMQINNYVCEEVNDNYNGITPTHAAIHKHNGARQQNNHHHQQQHYRHHHRWSRNQVQLIDSQNLSLHQQPGYSVNGCYSKRRGRLYHHHHHQQYYEQQPHEQQQYQHQHHHHQQQQQPYQHSRHNHTQNHHYYNVHKADGANPTHPISMPPNQHPVQIRAAGRVIGTPGGHYRRRVANKNNRNNANSSLCPNTESVNELTKSNNNINNKGKQKTSSTATSVTNDSSMNNTILT